LSQPGTFIEGKYEIVEKIREGGMGAIYKVRHRLLDEIRVVKVMKPQVVADEELKRRFAEEAKTATRLKHPNICTIHDFALDEDGTAYLVMEFIDGANLADLLRSQGPPGLALTLQIAHQALLALGYLHRRNVVHRDIAPDNLMLTHDEDGLPRIKLIDLGIAKALDRTGADLTSTGIFLGKLKYASPEQYGSLAAGEKIDGRSDLYSLGVVLYELLTGKRPLQGDTPPQLLRAHLFQPPTPFSETDPEGRIPEEVRAAVLKALEKNRDARYATAEEFDREIVTLLHRYGGAGELDSTVQLLSKFRRPSTPDDPGVTITPSAQNRLDRQFGAHTTPPPSRETLLSADRVPAQPSAAARPSDPARTQAIAAGDTLPARREPLRSAGWKRIVAAVAVLVVAAGLVLLLRRSREPGQAAAVIPAAPTAAAPRIVPTAPARREPTAAEVVVPAPVATEAPSTVPRTAAPRPAHALPAERSPRVRIAERPEERPRPAEAPPVPTAPPREPARSPAVPTAVPAELPRPTAAAPEPPRKTVSDEDRVREVIREYVAAQSGLDVDRYLRVRPALASQREQIERSFAGLRSQEVRFEVRTVEVRGNQAEVHGHESRTISPRVGSDQRFEANRVVTLERRGSGWIITDIR
jgi:serine/threonine protein kinase/ketosteroid isomerase-like protein